MSKVKPIFREVRQAVVDGMAHSKDKLPQLTKNMDDHLDDVVKKVKGNDHFDGPDGSGPSTHPYRPDPSRKPPSMSDEDYSNLLESSVHNPDGLEAVLGKFRHEDTASYIDVAEGKKPPATYFSLGNEWGDIASAHNLDDKGMFDAFNVPFLERMMAEGKPISFSHNPQDFPGSALGDELQFLLDSGYVFDPATMRAYLP